MVQLLDKVPPYSQEAERAVLGSMLIDREALERALELLDEKSFYEEQNQKIFSVIKTLSLNNRVVDTVTLAEELRTMNYLSSAGGAEYIAELINTVATAAHIDNYAEIVKEKAILRDLIRAATQMVGECFQENEGANSLLDKAEGLIYSIAEKKARTGLAPLSEMIHEMIENLEVLHQRKETVTGVPSGFKRFDDMTAGFQRGNLVILAARPGVGKTALALNIALQSLRTGFFKKSDWPIITRKAELLSEAPIYLDYSNSAMSILTLRSSARRMAAQLASKATPLSLIIIDYLQLMQGSRKNLENRQNEIAEISRSLKGLARDLNVPIIALSQLNRSPEERGREGKPQLSDLRESGALEQDADMVGFIYREAMYKKDPDEELLRKAKLIIAKQRNGPLGEIDLIFLKECARFENLEPEAD